MVRNSTGYLYVTDLLHPVMLAQVTVCVSAPLLLQYYNYCKWMKVNLKVQRQTLTTNPRLIVV